MNYIDASPIQPQQQYHVSMNTSGIFTHTKAEAILQHLLNVVSSHENELSCHREMLGTPNIPNNCNGIKEEPIIQKLCNIEQSIENLNQRLDDIESKIAMPGGTSTSMAIGEVVASNIKSIARTMQLLSTKAESDYVRTLIQQHNQEIQDFSTEISNEFLTDKHSFAKMKELVHGLSDRVEVMNQDLSNKLDKTFYTSVVESDISTIREHADFVNHVKDVIPKLEAMIAKEVQEKIQAHDTSISSLSNNVEVIQENLKENYLNPYAVEEEIRILTENVEELQERIDEEIIKQSEINDDRRKIHSLLHETVNPLKEGYHSLQEEINQITTLSSKPFSASLLQKIYEIGYSKKETQNLLSKCVQKIQFHEVLKELRQEIDSKSSELSADELSHQLDNTMEVLTEFQDDYEVTKRRALLAIQFVDWYSRKED